MRLAYETLKESILPLEKKQIISRCMEFLKEVLMQVSNVFIHAL